ncbi:unnamed protein product [Parnassius apollo]|nr:unnamed protein product [Parnassius apollo]
MPLTSAERQKRYRERLKQNNPIKWNEEKKKDAEKKRRNYKKISELSETEKVIRRKIWRQLKQKQLNHNDKTDKNSSRKIYKERYYRITKENKKQKRKIDILKKHVDSLRKRVYRYKL